MTLTIELEPEKVFLLEKEAERRGIPLMEYARQLVEKNLTEGPPPTPSSPQERAAAFGAWAESHAIDAPLLSDEAVSRESIYSERG